MRIKKLDIVGFKSFCDRSIIRFDSPITGVVGPNGCGKSNVVDAIRWCMGEQSAKHLRGKAMEDVIFQGSDRRGPLGYCEVSLTFENDGRLPVEYLQYTEVTVTRRLFRDGTSEYYLNKTPCRLRDITEFFMGTGIGTRAYSIIEQGRVGMIVSSKPEERRFLIEEAAGITKYKLRRKAAEKKLELTKQNLLRVSDVVSEQERQLASLKRQAEKAERYKRYRAELRDIELWGYSQKWLGLLLEERVYRGLVEAAGEGLQAAETARLTMEAELSALRLTLSGDEQGIGDMQEELYALDNEVRLGEAENEHARKEEARLLEQAQRLRAEQDQLHVRSEEAAAELLRLQGELAALESLGEGQGDRVSGLEAALKAHKEALSAKQREADGIKAEIARQNQEIARSEAAERSGQRQIDDLSSRLSRFEDEVKRLVSRKAELEDEIAGQEQRLGGLHEAKLGLAKTRQAAEERVKDLRLLVSRLDKEVDHVKNELARKRARLHSVSELSARNEGFSLGSRMLLKRKKETEDRAGGKKAAGGEPGEAGAEAARTVADLVIAPAELEVALDAVLGDRLGALLVDTQEEGAASIQYLRDKGEGKATLVPMDARPTRPSDRPPRPDEEAAALGVRGRLLDLIQKKPFYEAVLDALLGHVLVLDTLEHALAYYKAASEDGSLAPGALLVTLDGVLLDGHGAMTGGAQKGQGASVLSYKRELRELTAEVARLEEQWKAQDEQLAVSKKEQQHLQQQLEELGKAGHQGEMQMLSLDKDLSKAREEQHRTAHRLEVLGREQGELAGQRESLERESEEARLLLRGARDMLVQLEGQLDGQSREHVKLLEAVEAAGSELTQVKVQAAAHREKLASTRQSLARIESEQRERAQSLERKAQEERGCYQKAAQLSTEVSSRGAGLSERAGRRQRLAEEHQMARSAYEQKRQELGSREVELQKRRDRESSEVKQGLKLKARLGEIQLARQHVEEAVLEKHRVAVADVVSDYHLRPQVKKTDEERAKELRDLIERMGEINLTAIDEYRELEQRHGFLVAQKTDLETALGQLEQAIVLINKTSRQRFREVFDLINAKFQELFPRCFTGGQARLGLTTSDDVLEAGVEIFAQPPGKKNQSVELLSGGEKAMTAVALIFAIFLIKPSPFCLLDEVDAPLDEANVGRFNDLIRSMTDRSQFILITHNKRTMQIADTLYGVTMEEPGVSKVVSVNLNDMSKLAPKKKAA